MDGDGNKQSHLVGGDALARANLSSQHLLALSSIYFDGMTQQQVAAVMGVQQPRVSKIVTEALRLLEAAGLPPPRERQRHRTRYYAPSALERIADRQGE